MKLGIMMALFSGVSFEQALENSVAAGLDAVEIGAGNYPGSAHCPLKELIKSKDKARAWAAKVTDRGLSISALACHGNPLHPDPKIARAHHDVWRDAVKLASMIGVDTITGFSGCPGGSDRDLYPNWVVCSWPNDFVKILKYQWDKKIIPYWKREAKFAADHGVRMAFEMHQGMSVYNTETLLRVRSECGKSLGCNFDPSHLFWQGIDPIESIQRLGKMIVHVHAKDCKVNERIVRFRGVIDWKHYGQIDTRAWNFRTIGYGHGLEFWNEMVSALRMVGYDWVLSIEHEDPLMSVQEGLDKTINFLNQIMLHEPVGKMWWEI